jgi:hypothetical protein
MIHINENTLSSELISDLLSWNESTKGGDVWASNQTKWIPSLKYATSGTILSRVMLEEYKVKIYNELYSRKILDYIPYSSSALLYIGGPNSCVNWHADYEDYDAMSIYLNENWDSNWGGWFAYTELHNRQTGDIKPQCGNFIVPKYNLSIRSTDMEWHCTTPISSYADPRISIQLFFSKNK